MEKAKSASVTSSGSQGHAKKQSYYAVRRGHKPGIYLNWNDAKQQITGFKNNQHQKFASYEEAQNYMRATSTPISLNGHRTSRTPSVAEGRKGSKRQKKNDGSPLSPMMNGDYEPGTAPLLPDAEDGFDRRIKHGPPDGPPVVYKTQAELNATKLQPTGDFQGELKAYTNGALKAREAQGQESGDESSDSERQVFTDGACKGNGRGGSYGGWGVWFGPEHRKNACGPLVADKHTNQKAELTAIARALDTIAIDRSVKIYTDSYYGINCITEWYQTWVKNGWKNAAGKPVENRDLIEPILVRIKERELAKATTRFQWVKGHSKLPGKEAEGNAAADRLANQGAAMAAAMKLEARNHDVNMLANENDELDEFDMDGFERGMVEAADRLEAEKTAQ